ncbi:MAG TPA: hemerythrin domain-containing protein [Actinomycetota bacterium]
MDAVSLLKQDHRTVEELFRRYESTEEGGDRTAIVREITRELSVHAAIEEQVLYPEVEDVLPDGSSMAGEAIQEHQEAKELLAELDRMDATDPGFDPKVRSLISDVRHHVEEEENEMLPRLASAVPADTLDELGTKMERAKQMAPTRPHPHAPSSPPANLVAGLAGAVVDRVRDAISDRSSRPSRAKKASASRSEEATTSRAKRAGTTSSSRSSRSKTTSNTGGRRAKGRTAKTRASSPRSRTKSATPVIRVKEDPRGGWRADKQGSSRAVARSDTKRDVVKRARELARSQGGRLVVHNTDGGVQEDRSYS